MPSLHVKTGETREISAQRWEFASVTIEPNATLFVTEGSQDILHLIVDGDFILRGQIRYEKALDEARTETVKGENGQPLNLSYTASNKGGRGGNGLGRANRRGGTGANPTADWGGGGGSGAQSLYQIQRTEHHAGADAVDQYGATNGQYGAGTGGDGGERRRYGAGGIILVEVGGAFDGSGGKFLVRGSAGRNGQRGDKAIHPGTPKGLYRAKSGDGGGGPGGSGGFIVVHVSGSVVAYAGTRTSGGAGGVSLTTGRGAGKGQPGQRGSSGAVFWFVP